MKRLRRRRPAVDQAPHLAPGNPAVLAAARKRPMSEPAYLMTEQIQRGAVHGHSVIAEASTQQRRQPLDCVLDGSVHSSPPFGIHRVLLRLQPLANRLPQRREISVAPLLPAYMREAGQVERLRLPFSAPLPVSSRKRSELQKPRLVGMRFKTELPKPLGKFRPKLLGIRFAQESKHDVVRVPDDDYIAVRLPSAPPSRASPHARGLCGSLILHDMKLAFNTLRRFYRYTRRQRP